MRRLSIATRPRSTPQAVEHEPFAALNTTPLIDVMLVLLIMFIITIPAALHELPVNLPGPGRAAEAVTHELAVARDGTVTLDGAAVDGAALAARLRTIATVGDVLTVRTDPEARYERFAATLGVVKRAGVTRLGFAGARTREF